MALFDCCKVSKVSSDLFEKVCKVSSDFLQSIFRFLTKYLLISYKVSSDFFTKYLQISYKVSTTPISHNDPPLTPTMSHPHLPQ